MIHSVRFRNYKALRDVAIDLGRFTILVGPNASGKTSLLEGVHHLSRLASTDPRHVLVGKAGLGVVASRGAEGLFELDLAGTFRGKKGELTLSFNSIEDFPFTDTYLFESRWGERRFSTRRALNPPEEEIADHPGAELGLGLVLREAAFLRFDLDRLAEPSYSELPTPIMGHDGRGLAAVLADMAVSRPDDFARLQEALRAVIPGLVRVRLVRAKVARHASPEEEPVWGHEVVFDMAGAADIPARAASEGLLRVLGLFAALLAPERREIVLIDRLERAVSPRSLGELMSQIHQILELDPDLQIVATSDASGLLDHHVAEHVLVHCLLEDGSVRIKPLSRHPEFGLLSRDLRPGEFWSQVGDAWVAERPRTVPPPLPQAVPPPLPLLAGDVEAPTIEAHAWPPGMPPLPTNTGGG